MMDSPKIEPVPSLVEAVVEKQGGDDVSEPDDERRGWSYDDSIDMIGYPVRVFINGGKTCYVNKDACTALDYRNSRKALDHVPKEDVTQIYILDKNGTHQLTNVLTLRGLLILILR